MRFALLTVIAMTIFNWSSALRRPQPQCWNATLLQTFFTDNCLEDAGNAAFWRFATSPESAAPGIVAHTPTTSCFVNHQDPQDWLCIFRDFDIGQTSIDSMFRETLQQNLQILFTDGWQLRGPREGPNDRDNMEHICFHRRGTGSVQWTHAHIFQRLPPPDGMQLVGGWDTYCASVGPLNAIDPSIAASRAAQDIVRQIITP
jgi:hypothetical protein